MNYLLDKNTVFKNRERPRRGGRIVWVALILVLILFFAGNFVYKIFSPVLVPVASLAGTNENTSASFFSFFKNNNQLSVENEKLRQELSKLKQSLRANDLAEQELVDLQKITHRYKDEVVPIVAKVFRRPPFLPFDTFLIDVGRKTAPDISLGDKVLVDNSILIGEIVQIGKNMSKIKMYSSPKTKLGVVIGVEKVPANAVGVGGGNFTVELPRGVEIHEGDKVVYQDLQEYILGAVGNVDNDPRHTLQTIYISSPINIYELPWIQIVTK